MLYFIIEKALKKALKYHPELTEKLRRLEEKDILITLLPFKQEWSIIFSYGEVRCFNGKGRKKPDLHISATPKALLAMIIKEDKTGLQLEGDMVLAQILQQCLSATDIDWEKFIYDHVGESMGNMISFPVTTFLRKTRKKIKQINQETKIHVADYLQEDMDYLPLSSETQDFYTAVDDLKYRVDRLEAKWKLYKDEFKINSALSQKVKELPSNPS